MSELDKKYSDFQENECETQDPEAPIVEEYMREKKEKS